MKVFGSESISDIGNLLTETNSMFDAFIHIDADNTKYVYHWRLQAEQKMRQERGKGMTDDQVVTFVNGCKYIFRPISLKSQPDLPNRLSSLRTLHR
jgi:pantothenate kinase-related protein Tda10